MTEWIPCRLEMPPERTDVFAKCKVGYNFADVDDRPIVIKVLYWEEYFGKEKWFMDCGCSGYEFDAELFDVISWKPFDIGLE